MLNVTDLRAGVAFQMEGVPYIVLQYTHTKMGRGTANVRVQARNLRSGAIEEKTFMSNARVESAATTKRKMTFLYSDGQMSYFMDPRTYEQFEIANSITGGQVRFLKDGEVVDILFFNSEPLLIELAPKVTLKVTDTGPGVKGNSASNVWKPATLENGLVVKVPLFIEVGEMVRVDTRNSNYVEREKA